MGAAFGLGALCGALWFGARAKKFSFFTLLSCNYLGYLVSVLVLYFHLPRPVVLAATTLCGVPFGAFGAMITSLILLRTAKELRSKTLGLYATATYTVESLCVLALAALIEAAGLQNTLLTGSAVFGGLVILSVWARRKEDFWPILSSGNKKVFTK